MISDTKGPADRQPHRLISEVALTRAYERRYQGLPVPTRAHMYLLSGQTVSDVFVPPHLFPSTPYLYQSQHEEKKKPTIHSLSECYMYDSCEEKTPAGYRFLPREMSRALKDLTSFSQARSPWPPIFRIAVHLALCLTSPASKIVLAVPLLIAVTQKFPGRLICLREGDGGEGERERGGKRGGGRGRRNKSNITLHSRSALLGTDRSLPAEHPSPRHSRRFSPLVL